MGQEKSVFKQSNMKQSWLFLFCLFLSHCSNQPSSLEIEVSEAMRGSDQDFIWTQARAAAIPDDEGSFVGLMTMSQKLKSGDDVYYDLYQSQSTDRGESWSEPGVIPGLRIHEIGGGSRRSMSDMTPQWHAASGKVLNIGKFFFYTDDSTPDRSRREVAYAVYDPDTKEWGPYRVLELPEHDTEARLLTAPGSGCVQYSIEKNGDVFLPIAYRALTEEEHQISNRETFDVRANMNNDDIGGSVAIVRCSFDGEMLTFLEIGNSLTVKQGRGFSEPSIAKFAGKWFMTIRSDKTAWVATSRDGLFFEGLKEWTFDEGSKLGSYNTQQHWAIVRDGLYLIYTRPDGTNDHVFRHRAPLYIGRVDPDRIAVLKATEQVCIPEDGVALGNFGVTQVADNEVWVVAAEYHRDDKPENQNRVWMAKIK